jgi:hypothetical protein
VPITAETYDDRPTAGAQRRRRNFWGPFHPLHCGIRRLRLLYRPTDADPDCGDNKVFSMLSHRHISGSSLTKSIALEIAGSHDLY